MRSRLATGIATLTLAGICVGVGTAIADSAGPSPPPGITSINSHPIGTVGSATEGVGGMQALCKLPADHYPPANATLDQVKALCAQYGTGR
jgi:hypothetical protein